MALASALRPARLPPENDRLIASTYRWRVKVWHKTGGYCWMCFEPLDFWNWQADHYIPRAIGGSDGLTNRWPSCRGCNSKKGCGLGPHAPWEFFREIYRPHGNTRRALSAGGF